MKCGHSRSQARGSSIWRARWARRCKKVTCTCQVHVCISATCRRPRSKRAVRPFCECMRVVLKIPLAIGVRFRAAQTNNQLTTSSHSSLLWCHWQHVDPRTQIVSLKENGISTAQVRVSALLMSVAATCHVRGATTICSDKFGEVRPHQRKLGRERRRASSARNNLSHDRNVRKREGVLVS